MADIPISPDSGSLTITPTGVTILNALPMYFAKSLPALDVVGESIVGTKLGAAATLPMLVVTGAMQDIRLPMLTAAATLLPGNVTTPVQSTKSIPAVEATGTILRGSVYDGEASLPAFTLEASFGTFASVTLPQLTSTGTALNGRVSTAAVSLPRLTATGAAYSDGLLSAAASLPALTIAVEIDTGRVMEASITLKKLALAAAGYSGTVGTAAVSLPIFTMDGAGHGEYIGQASIELPMLQLVATLPLQTGLTETVSVFAMNTKNGALTNYDNFNFNSMTRFNGAELMANDSGIFAITGNLDESAIIEAYARTGITDFGTPNHKRVEYAYIGYRSDGEMRLKLIVDEHHEYEYQVYPRNYDDIHGNRLKLGRGAKGTYWQIEIGNVDGSNIEGDFLQLMAEPLSRKV